MKRLYRVELISRERLTFVLEAESEDGAIDEASDSVHMGDGQWKSRAVEDVFVHDVSDVTEEYRDHDSGNDRARDEDKR